MASQAPEDTGNLSLWDPRTGKRLLFIGGHEEEIRSVAFSPDGRLLATGNEAGQIGVWSIGRG